jgi:hypothetical protein
MPNTTDFEAVRSFVPYSGSAAINYLPAFTSVNGSVVTFVVTGSTVIAAGPTIFVS